MLETPKSLRLHISVFGKRNVGKSSLINKLTGQNLSIVSDIAGTTTDPVEKAIEFSPIGPVVIIDTAGVDDNSSLGKQRIEKTFDIINRTDIALFVCDYRGWDKSDENLYNTLQKHKIPTIIIVNKTDEASIEKNNLNRILKLTEEKDVLFISVQQDFNSIDKIKQKILEKIPDEFITSPSIVGDLVDESSLCILVTPIDKQAPKGRLILPEVQTIRDILDNGCSALVVREKELKFSLATLNKKPDLVITDSQAFEFVDSVVPDDIDLTSFSILFARLKGDLATFIEGAKTIDTLENGDKILISESCSHHQTDDDIARVKIPKMLKNKTGKELFFDYKTAHDFKQDLSEYKLIIQCGGCMTNRKEILSRIVLAKSQNVAISNYGIVIAHCLGILERAVKPFLKTNKLSIK